MSLHPFPALILESRLIPVDLDPKQDYGVLEKGAKYEEDAGYYPRLETVRARRNESVLGKRVLKRVIRGRVSLLSSLLAVSLPSNLLD